MKTHVLITFEDKSTELVTINHTRELEFKEISEILYDHDVIELKVVRIDSQSEMTIE